MTWCLPSILISTNNNGNKYNLKNPNITCQENQDFCPIEPTMIGMGWFLVRTLELDV